MRVPSGGRRVEASTATLFDLQEVGDLVGAAGDLRLHGAVDVDAHGEVDAALQVEAEVEVLASRPAPSPAPTGRSLGPFRWSGGSRK